MPTFKGPQNIKDKDMVLQDLMIQHIEPHFQKLLKRYKEEDSLSRSVESFYDYDNHFYICISLNNKGYYPLYGFNVYKEDGRVEY